VHARTPPPLRLTGVNRIPLERGLGSSSAAAVAGVVLGSRVFDLAIDGGAVDARGTVADPYSVFSLAAEIEGHPDNAAAAAFGGFTIAMPDGLVRRLEVHPEVRPVALIPLDVRLPTAEARRALADRVDRADAVFNAAHAALAIEALTREPDLLGEALRDRLHQDARLELVPSVRRLFDELRAAAVPVCVSGAGPALLAFESRERPVPDPGDGWRALRTSVRAVGAEVLPP
jgi:homoserine kinase